MARVHHFIRDPSNGRNTKATNDCLIRALAISLEVPWSEVIELVDSYLAEYPFSKAGRDGTPLGVAKSVLSELGYRRVCPTNTPSDLWMRPLKNWIDVKRFPLNCIVITRCHAQAVIENRIHDLTPFCYDNHTFIREYWVN